MAFLPLLSGRGRPAGLSLASLVVPRSLIVYRGRQAESNPAGRKNRKKASVGPEGVCGLPGHARLARRQSRRLDLRIALQGCFVTPRGLQGRLKAPQLVRVSSEELDEVVPPLDMLVRDLAVDVDGLDRFAHGAVKRVL